MWSVLQALHGCCERAVKGSVIPGCGLDWAQYYYGHVESDRLCLNEWGAMTGLESVRRDSAGQSSTERVSVERQIKEELRDIMRTEDLENITSKQVRSALETRIGMDMKNYKEYIDNEMMVTMAQMDKPSKIFDYLFLGSEWNAANFEELQKNNVGYILNVTREIDNFFPESFSYMNIRVYDVEATDLLSHWKDTYSFINTARQSGQAVLVHCKMGVSRSGSTVVAYAMKQQRWPLEVALSYVRERRPIVQPNDGFMKQLHTYSGILNASQQRHSALWRWKSRAEKEQRKIERAQSAASHNNEEEEEEEESEEEEEEEELESPDEVDEADIEMKVLEEPAHKSETNPEAPPTEPAAPSTEPSVPNPFITVQVASHSPSRSGRMNLFSLMQSINELEDEDLRNEQIANSHRRSPGQRRRSYRRKGLMHQRAHVDVSPEPSRLSGLRKLEGAGPSKPETGEGDAKTTEVR